LRLQIWRSMRGVGNPELIPPLLNSLLQDPAEVRIAAIESLAADFPGDPACAIGARVVSHRGPAPAGARRGPAGHLRGRNPGGATCSPPSRMQTGLLRNASRRWCTTCIRRDRAELRTVPNTGRSLDELGRDDATLGALAETLPNAGKVARRRERNSHQQYRLPLQQESSRHRDVAGSSRA
jgi:hypothetical protein